MIWRFTRFLASLQPGLPTLSYITLRSALNLYMVDMDTSTPDMSFIDPVQDQFEWPEYLVFGGILAWSVGIGLYYGCCGNKQASNEEYLLGGRQMNALPVALSLLCSYVSSITLLGHPVEVYMYGMQFIMLLLCYIPLTLSLVYLFIPLYFDLQITSMYEYLELRFNRKVRLFLSVINIVYTIFYMAMVVYGPALALSFVTGISHRTLVAVIFLVCIFYSTLGGFKAVLWTDTLQAFIMLISMVVLLAVGVSYIDGGWDTIWQRAGNTGRLNFFNFDADPRTRHTIWTSLFGGFFIWLPMYINQAQIQRYISLPSMKSVKIAMTVNLCGLFLVMGVCHLCGLVIYATYFDCDPIATKRVKAVDQLVPVFVMDTLGTYAGLPGLLVAGITCAALSTVSSGVNSLAAVITEDYIRKWRPGFSDTQMALASKICALVTGMLAFGFVFIAEQMGNIFAAAATIMGIMSSPPLGVFICGQLFPWANTVGTMAGLAVSFIFSSFLGIGSVIIKSEMPSQALALDYSGEDCKYKTEATLLQQPQCDFWKDCETSGLVKFLSISYMWQPAIGTLTAIILGLAFSLAYRSYRGPSFFKPVPSKLLVPTILKLWLWLCPEKLGKVVHFEDSGSTEKLAGDSTEDMRSSKFLTLDDAMDSERKA